MSNDFLAHYGTPHQGATPHSGRYPWDPYKHPYETMALVNELIKANNGDRTAAAKAAGISTTEFRQIISIASAEKKSADISRCRRMFDHDGIKNLSVIAEKTGLTYGTVRNYLNSYEKDKASTSKTVAEKLKEELKTKKYLDVGLGSEAELGVKRTTFQTALKRLQDEGYLLDDVKVEQAGNPGQYTTVKVLGRKDALKKDIFNDYSQIKPIGEVYSRDNGQTWQTLKPPTSLDSSRIMIRYAEDGGVDKDGVIELRRNVPDLSLGNSRYAQVRIAVDGTHYLKGMAMYANKMPDGVDVIFNTNKPKGTPMMSDDPEGKEVLKKLKTKDPENPFGALIKANGQSYYIGEDGKEHLSPINKVKEEGEWTKWSKSVSSQVLSKQTYGLAKDQLTITYKQQKDQLKEIESLTNPYIKQYLLNDFADKCDSAAVHLKAAAFPRQAYKVILPITGLSEHEIYAPTYRNGEQVALIRYPHGGIFEIPTLKVNNNNKQAKSLINNAPDAVGINAKVAEQLSGADFDGDTVLVVPLSNTKLKTAKPLEGLKDFNPSAAYPGYPGMKVMKDKQKQMGVISNLITDMTLQGAPEEELVRAVRHSMVVIDAEKHKLNYRQSYIDNGIEALKKKYQLDPTTGKKGAATLISRASSDYRIPEVKDYYKVDKETGQKIFMPTGRYYIDKKGNKIEAQTRTTKMYATEDATTLISKSNTRMEQLYASYANNLKAMANEARKESVNMKLYSKDPSAAKTYSEEVATLTAKLNDAMKNKPRERQAQLLANAIYRQKVKDYEISKDDQKKVKTQALTEARARTGAISRSDRVIMITDKEWEAIQSHAISGNQLKTILQNTDVDDLKQRAMPRTNGIASSKKSLIKSLLSTKGPDGKPRYTQAEIADMVGVSSSTVSKVSAGDL